MAMVFVDAFRRAGFGDRLVALAPSEVALKVRADQVEQMRVLLGGDDVELARPHTFDGGIA